MAIKQIFKYNKGEFHHMIIERDRKKMIAILKEFQNHEVDSYLLDDNISFHSEDMLVREISHEIYLILPESKKIYYNSTMDVFWERCLVALASGFELPDGYKQHIFCDNNILVRVFKAFMDFCMSNGCITSGRVNVDWPFDSIDEYNKYKTVVKLSSPDM